ncbi:MAG: hypothetical protein KF886_17480 [Candidatus Hydrogenedentes bacterium]|nr:hypothetical protein [Candidatus Hydrogenedentota bacterium]
MRIDEERIKAIAGNPAVTVPAVLIACWITILFPPASYLSIVFLMLGAVALSQTGKYGWIVLIVLLHPVPVFFATGLAAHASGAPYILVKRSADSRLPRLDYTTRGEVLSVKSRFPWGGWIRLYPHNIAMQLSTRVFGLPEGAYDGPCPGRRQITAELASCKDFPLEELLADRVIAGEKTIELQPGTGQRLIAGFQFTGLPRKSDESEDKTLETRSAAYLLGNKCLILLLRDVGGWDRREVAVLIDAEKGMPFACHDFGTPARNPGFSYYRGWPEVTPAG